MKNEKFFIFNVFLIKSRSVFTQLHLLSDVRVSISSSYFGGSMGKNAWIPYRGGTIVGESVEYVE